MASQQPPPPMGAEEQKQDHSDEKATAKVETEGGTSGGATTSGSSSSEESGEEEESTSRIISDAVQPPAAPEPPPKPPLPKPAESPEKRTTASSQITATPSEKSGAGKEAEVKEGGSILGVGQEPGVGPKEEKPEVKPKAAEVPHERESEGSEDEEGEDKGPPNVPRHLILDKCKPIGIDFAECDIDLTRAPNVYYEYFKTVSRQTRSIPTLLILLNFFALISLIILSNILRHLKVDDTTSNTTLSSIKRNDEHQLENLVCELPGCRAISNSFFFAKRPKDENSYCTSITQTVCTRWINMDKLSYTKAGMGAGILLMEDLIEDFRENARTYETGSATPNALQKAALALRICENDRTDRVLDSLLPFLWERYPDLAKVPFDNADKVNTIGMLRTFWADTYQPLLFRFDAVRMLPTDAADSFDENKVVPLIDCEKFVLESTHFYDAEDGTSKVLSAFIKYVYDKMDIFFQNNNITTKNIYLDGATNEVVNVQFYLIRLRRKFCFRRRLKLIPNDFEVQYVIRDWFGANYNQIAVRSFRYLTSVSKMLTNKHLNNYVAYRILMAYFEGMSFYYKDTLTQKKFFDQYYALTDNYCLVKVSEIMPFAMGRLFIDLQVPIQRLISLEKFVNRIKVALQIYLMSRSGLDRTTVERVTKHIRNSKVMIGGPNWVFDDIALNEYYKGLNITVQETSFFEVFKNSLKHHAQMRFQYLEMAPYRYHQPLVPLSLLDIRSKGEYPRRELLYNLIDNTIFIPASLLTIAYYDENLPSSLNFAGLGFLLIMDIISEIFLHGIPDQRMLDQQRHCMAELISTGTAGGGKTSQTSSFGSNLLLIANVMRATYMSYHYHLGMEDDLGIRHNDSVLKPDQQYFIYAARSLCTIYRDKHWYNIKRNTLARYFTQADILMSRMNELRDAWDCPKTKLQRSLYSSCFMASANDNRQ